MSKPLDVGRGVVKGTAMLVGACTTLVCGMALLGQFVASGWLRAGGALVLMILLPALVMDRLLPKDDPRGARGLPTDVFALFWMGVPVLVVVVFGAVTRGSLLIEGQRQAAAGNASLARLAFALAGKADDVVAPVPASSASASVNAAASASGAAALPSQAAPAASAPLVAPQASEPPPRKQAAGESTPAELFKRLAPAVVTIVLMDEREREVSGGTGFVIDAVGTTVTNHHVIEEGKKIRAKFIDGATYEDVTLLTDDAPNDLALLRLVLNKPKSGSAPIFEPLKLGDSDAVVVGERAISIGNPLGLDHTLTDGLVSARRMIDGRAWIQMSVPVSPGNSGGPLFNMRGEVIGITTAQLGFGRGQNLNVAIPVKTLVQHVQAIYPEARPFGQGAASSHW